MALTPLLSQLDDRDAVIHLCVDGADPGELPDDPRIAMYGGMARTGMGPLLNRVLDASEAAELLLLLAGDQLASHAWVRLF